MPEPMKRGIQLANNVTELTAIAPLVPGGAEALRALFAKRKAEEKGGKPGPLEAIETIHYARWVILGDQLLFASNFDGDLESYLAEFAERDEGPLNGIFRYCQGWPNARPVGPFIQYVRDRMVPAEYYYGAYPQYTVKEVKRALYWKEKTEDFICCQLPKLADFVAAIEKCSNAMNPKTKECLTAQGFDPDTIKGIREKIRMFLKKLAAPTPRDFGKKGRKENPSEVSS